MTRRSRLQPGILPDQGSVRRRLLDTVVVHPEGITSRAVADLLGMPWGRVSSGLSNTFKSYTWAMTQAPAPRQGLGSVQGVVYVPTPRLRACYGLPPAPKSTAAPVLSVSPAPAKRTPEPPPPAPDLSTAEVLDVLEASEIPLPASRVAVALVAGVEAVEATLERLEGEGRVRRTGDGRWMTVALDDDDEQGEDDAYRIHRTR